MPDPNSSSRLPRPHFRVRPGWLALLAVIPAVFFAWYASLAPLDRAFGAIRFPYQLDREEGFLFEQAMRLRDGQTIYPDISSGYPLTVGNYPPVYPLLYAGATLARTPSLPLGRQLVLLSTVMLLAAMAHLALRSTANPWFGGGMAALACGLFLGTWEVGEWIAFARVDLPAIGFGMVGLAVGICSRRWPGALAAACCFLLAFFTKQTQVVAPAALFVAYLVGRQWSSAAVLALVFAGGAGAGTALLNWGTGGQFWLHAVVYNANEFVPGQVRVWLRHLVLFGGWKLLAAVALLAVALALAAWRAGRVGDRSAEGGLLSGGDRLFAAATAYLLFAGLTIPAIGKAGAAGNYLLEFQAAVALFSAVALGRLVDVAMAAGWRPGARRTAAVAAVLAVVLLTLHGGRTAFEYRRFFHPAPSPVEERIAEIVLLRALATDGPILTDFPVFATLANHPVEYQPFIMSQLAREGKWDESRFLQDLSAQRYSLIITDADLRDPDAVLAGFTPSMREAIIGGYRLEDRLGPFFLFVPDAVGDGGGDPQRAASNIAGDSRFPPTPGWGSA